MSVNVGQPIDRVDGLVKVRGAAQYAADVRREGVAHAVLVLSTRPAGTVTAIDTSAAMAVPGALAVLTPADVPEHLDREVRHDGQAVAMAVAESPEAAAEVAARVLVHLVPAPAVTSLEEARDDAFAPADLFGEPPDSGRGDPSRALPGAEVRIEAVYTTPMQNHHPIEPHAALVSWDGSGVVIDTSTQAVAWTRDHAAQRLGLAAEQVWVRSPFVGGGFGSKGGAWFPRLPLLAEAARRLGRPVKLVLAREQMFTLVGSRQPTRQRLVLGADRQGRLLAVTHRTIAWTSLDRDYSDPHGFATRLLYACPDVAVTHRLVRANVPAPNQMRAPGEATGTFALESALDELAVELGMDPVELRLRNLAGLDPHRGRPWSSNGLRRCLTVGAESFGWDRRTPAPRSMRDGRVLVGWGMAVSTYAANRWPASARARLRADGSVLVQTGSQDIGTGTCTVLAQVAADELGLPADRVTVQLGDSNLPPAPASVGQRTTASVAPAVRAATAALRERIRELAGAGESLAALARRLGGELAAEATTEPGDEVERFTLQAFGAHFAEVRVDPDLGQVRVSRITGAYAAGRILNPKTARSQLIGGVVFGIGLALMEATPYDARLGRILAPSFADYHLAVNADVPAIDVHVLDEDDPHVNQVGAKGIGMLGNVGTAPAIANAVFHASGRRIRDLPITPDKLL